MNPTSVSNYKKHRYSGPKKSRNRVHAQLKRFHDGEVSREKAWRKTPKQKTALNEISHSAGQKFGKSYSRKMPVVFVEATNNTQKCHELTTNTQPSASTSSGTKSFEINWPMTDPTSSSPELTVEENISDSLTGLTGYRIVDIQHVLRWAINLEKHTKTCTNSTIEFVRELRTGCYSIFIFKCSMCLKEFRESNEKGNAEKLNSGFDWGTITGGGWYSQAASHLTNMMGIPTIGANKFRKIDKSLRDAKDPLTDVIKTMGDQEREIVIENDQIKTEYYTQSDNNDSSFY